MSWFVTIAFVVIVLLFVPKYMTSPFILPKDTVMTTVGFCGLLWLVANGSVTLPSCAVYFSVALAAWFGFCCMFADRPDLAFGELFVKLGGVCFGLVALTTDFMLLAKGAILAGTLACAYAVLQRQFKFEPIAYRMINAQSKLYYATSFFGNVSYTATFIPAVILLTVWLALQTGVVWWLGLVPVQLWGLYVTENRTGWLALGVGLGFALMTVSAEWGVITAFVLSGMIWLAIVVNPRISGRFESVQDRLRYWQVALELVKERPIVGLGVGRNCAQTPFVHKRINERTNGEFLKPTHFTAPWNRYVHNEVLQAAVDAGIPGAMLYIGFIVYVFAHCADALLGAVFATLVFAGLFAHINTITATNALFWIIGFRLLDGTQLMTIPQLTIPQLFVACLVLGTMLFYFLGKDLAADIYLQQCALRKFSYIPIKALECRPRWNKLNSIAGGLFIKDANIRAAFVHCMTCVSDFDGREKYWEHWCNLGTVCLMGGSTHFATFCYKVALSFYPEYTQAQRLLAQVVEYNQAKGGA